MMRQPRLRTVLIGTGAAISVVAASTTAYAAVAGPIDGSGAVHGCYSTRAVNGSHVFVLQDTGTNCPAGTTPISWNQQGPAGANGSQGQFAIDHRYIKHCAHVAVPATASGLGPVGLGAEGERRWLRLIGYELNRAAH